MLALVSVNLHSERHFLNCLFQYPKSVFTGEQQTHAHRKIILIVYRNCVVLQFGKLLPPERPKMSVSQLLPTIN